MLQDLYDKIKVLLSNKADKNHAHSYLPLTGGTIDGTLSLSNHNSFRARHVDGSTDGYDGELYLNYNSPDASIFLGSDGYRIANNGSYYSGTSANADTVDGLHGSDLQKSMINLAKNTNVLEYADNYPVTQTGGTMFTYRVINGYNEPFADNIIGSGDYYYYANKLDNSWITLIAIHVRSSNMYMRNKYSGTWSNSWRCISDGGNAQNSVSTSNLNSTGFGSNTLTYLQTSDDFYNNTGWCHYLIANHGNGETYYNYTIGLPFYDAPMYQRQTGNTSARSGWQKFYTTENITYGTSALTPGSSSLATGSIYLQYE